MTEAPKTEKYKKIIYIYINHTYKNRSKNSKLNISKLQSMYHYNNDIISKSLISRLQGAQRKFTNVNPLK